MFRSFHSEDLRTKYSKILERKIINLLSDMHACLVEALEGKHHCVLWPRLHQYPHPGLKIVQEA